MTSLLLFGGRGLLGQAVHRAAERSGRRVEAARVDWADTDRAVAQVRHIVATMPLDGPTTIAWCAGAGVPRSPQSVFDAERRVFTALLDEMGLRTDHHLEQVRFFLASSAGAVYAGVEDPPYSETSPVRPLAPYGHAKLALEQDLRDACAATGMRAVAGRFSNLYGPGQDLGKAQGLVTVLLHNALVRRPSQIYVSMDTIRDYLYVDDAARATLSCLERVADEPMGSMTVKILASGQRLTIASLVGLTQRTIHRRPLIVQGASPYAKVQARDLSMAPTVWPDVDRVVTTSIVEGMHATYEDLRRQRLDALL